MKSQIVDRQFDRYGIGMCESPNAAVDLSKVLRLANIPTTVFGRIVVLDNPNVGDINVARVLWEGQDQ